MLLYVFFLPHYRKKEDDVLLTGILRYSELFGEESKDPPILSFRVADMRGSFDPLLCKWLRYQAVYEKPKDINVTRPETETPAADETFSDTDVRKKIFRSLHESVHSLSDKEKKRSSSRTDWSKGITANDEATKKNTLNDDHEIEVRNSSFNHFFYCFYFFLNLTNHKVVFREREFLYKLLSSFAGATKNWICSESFSALSSMAKARFVRIYWPFCIVRTNGHDERNRSCW